ncbi:hypothetical protein BDM02DRAFT_3192255 [Thelephora ganbajun]|uniref:Uncharacterized protein n=1 Tax=Thelephora ganbajun TaxID=370292 RepID=A0ACB6Z1Q9_THEGA|nr:hypothetical protein BDM02DRAFT_3192255 [Thelephora ganbajun]
MALVCRFASGAVLTVHLGGNNQGGLEDKVWTDTLDGPIRYISINNLGRVLAIGHGSEVTLLDQRTLSHWENIRTLPSPPEFTAGLPAPSPRTLHFTKEDHLVAVYLDHGIVCWDPSSMTILWSIAPRSCSIGCSAISPGEKHIIVSNLFDGLDFYSITDRALSHSVPCPINQQKNTLVPVLFNSDGSIIIVGGTSGSVRVLDSSSCETLQVLSHDGDLIQAIDSCMTQEGIQIIAAGVSEQGGETTIKVWTSQPAPEPRLSPPRSFAHESVLVNSAPG